MNSGSRCARCSCVEKLDALDLCIGFMLVLDDLYTDRKRARRKEQERYDRSRRRHRDLCAAFAAGDVYKAKKILDNLPSRSRLRCCMGQDPPEPVDLAQPDKQGYLPVHHLALGVTLPGTCAAAARDAERAKLLNLLFHPDRQLASGNVLTVVTLQLATPMHLCAQSGSVAVMRCILRRTASNPGLLSARDKQNYTPLDYAVRSMQWEAARLLIEHEQLKHSSVFQKVLSKPEWRNLASAKPFWGSGVEEQCATRAPAQNFLLTALGRVFRSVLEQYINTPEERKMREAARSRESQQGLEVNCLEGDEQIHAHRKKLRYQVSRVLKVSGNEAEQLLQEFGYDYEKLLQHYSKAEDHNSDSSLDSPRRADQCAAFPAPSLSTEAACPVCWCQLDSDTLSFAAACGHQGCVECWREYVKVKIEDGEVHSIRCIEVGCNYKLNELDVKQLISGPIYNRYLELSNAHFVAVNPQLRWCPNPACAQALEVDAMGGDFSKDAMDAKRALNITCQCGTALCWQCGKSAHEPAACEMMDLFVDKLMPLSKQEAQTRNEGWIASNTQMCPRCRAPIQKTAGCNHMTCTVCSNHFCWVCMRPWQEHSLETGGAYRCTLVSSAPTGSTENLPAPPTSEFLIQDLSAFQWAAKHFVEFNEALDVSPQQLAAAQTLLECTGPTSAAVGVLEMDLPSFHGVLTSARRTLAHSYVFSYFLQTRGTGGGRSKLRYVILLQSRLEAALDQLTAVCRRVCQLIPEPERTLHRIQNPCDGSTKRRRRWWRAWRNRCDPESSAASSTETEVTQLFYEVWGLYSYRKQIALILSQLESTSQAMCYSVRSGICRPPSP